jgi:methylase of polypeptide subunit release factors
VAALTGADAPEFAATPEAVARLRSDVAGFTVDAVADLLGPVAHRALAREQLVPAAVVAARHAGEPLATLLAAFVLGRPVTRRALAAALPALGVTGAEALGIVTVAGGGDDDEARALVELRPYAAVDDGGATDWWLVADLGDTRTGAPLRPDHVLGVGGASTTLARSTVRHRVGRVLDVGTGCGVQAVHAARHARHVTGTDTSRRALAVAALNWRLNAAEVAGTELDLRHGSLLEPVTGATFDLVVSNPPFVISPRTGPGPAAPTLEYRDAGFVGDTLVQRLLSGIPHVLAPGGTAQLLGNWELRRGEEWTGRVGGWLDDGATRDLDAWVVQREVQDPAEYVELWMRDAGQHAAPDAEQLYAAWLADFEARGVEAVGFGLLTLRRPAAGPPTLRRLEERRTGELPAGHEVAAALAAHDWLAARDDDALLAGTLRVASGVTEERHHLPGAEEPAAILLRHGADGRVVQVSTAVAGLVGACDGTLEVGRIVGALGTLLERPVAEVAAEVLPAVRGLVADGLLLTG